MGTKSEPPPTVHPKTGDEHPTSAKAATFTAVERRQSRRLLIVLVLIALFFVVELIGAKLARSDVLRADAFHLLMDVFALAISLGAMRVASRRPSSRFTFGLRRAEPLAALANGVLVLGAATEIVCDAIGHLENTTIPHSGLMLAFSSAALVVNGLNAWLLHGAMGGHGHAHHGHAHAHHGHAHGHHGHAPAHDDHAPAHDDHAPAHDDHAPAHDDHTDHGAHTHQGAHVGHRAHTHDEGKGQQLNLRGAWLHLLGDALGSVAAFSAGLAIRLGASPIVDPLASFVVVAILVVGALRLLRDAGYVLLEAAPPHLSVEKVETALLSLDGIDHVSALHVWSLGTGHDAISAHVRGSASTNATLGSQAAEHLRKTFAVEYVTVQVDAD